jgi:predicted 2-oxoglutarate/Fe(II)-dependent dioxygenase YbiX
MKTIAVVSIALAVLATPAFVRVRHQQQNQTWTYGQVDTGYQPSQVRPGDVPFAPF